MEKYLQAVLEQIRCKKVHPYIREELMGHIQDQMEDNQKSGMSEKEAEEAAVRDMGDPVEIGVEFDRIHRPQIAWKMLIVIGVISLLGILVHFFITRQIADSNLWDSSVSGSSRYAFHVLLGLVLMFVSMLVVLMIGIGKGWFQVAKKKAFALMGLVVFGFPLGGLAILLLQAGSLGYYFERVQSFYMGSDGLAYYASLLDAVRDNAKWIGGCGMKVLEFIQDGNRGFILSYVTASYGLLAAIIICCLLAVLVVFVFSASLHQKNQLGLAMGCGCGMVFLMNLAANILINMGILPAAWTFLPFLSAGGNNIVLCYVLVGIVLSIYRYKNIYPMHVSTKLAFPGKNVQ